MIELRHRQTGAILLRVDGAPGEGLDVHEADLRFADLSGASLAGANFCYALLAGATLQGADLTGANLSRAYLQGADLRDANLRAANLSGSSLDSADCTGACLVRADLTGAFLAETRLTRTRLAYANLHGAYLAGADLTGAWMAFTLLTGCRGLHEAHGLAEVEHLGPSAIDVATLREAMSDLPNPFLQGVGLTLGEIHGLRSATAKSNARRAVRLAFADEDADFVERLCQDLQAADMSCWRDRRDLGGGYFLQILSNRAEGRDDAVLLVCSRASLASRDLADTAVRAIRRERETGRQVLFTLRLDEALLDGDTLSLADEWTAPEDWRERWIRYVGVHGAVDFRGWRRDPDYQRALGHLLQALADPAPRAALRPRTASFPR
jgi:hypothetical protein